jgi:c-di-AMP phosphodiesterase-like protein
MTPLGQLLLWMVEHWALLLALIGFVIILQSLKKIAEQLSYILIELRDINKDTRQMLREINEKIERNTAEISAFQSIDLMLSESLQVLYRIEDKLSPPRPPYLTPTGDRL